MECGVSGINNHLTAGAVKQVGRMMSASKAAPATAARLLSFQLPHVPRGASLSTAAAVALQRKFPSVAVSDTL